MRRSRSKSEGASSSDDLSLIGAVVGGGYEILTVIGEGGMAVVFEARRVADGSPVAIKVMRADATGGDAVQRFEREAKAAASLHSPHVAAVLDVGWLQGNRPFIVMDRLRGETLTDLMRWQGQLPVATAIDYLLQACEGIAVAHARGIVHRDIKPSNLFIAQEADGSSRLKVLDFGISKVMELEGLFSSGLTKSNATLGSPQYMSPEQLRSAKNVDARTDIWALGLILFRMLTARPAFKADSVGEHFEQIMVEPPVALRTLRPDAPPGLEHAVARCLQKDLPRRYQDVGQLAVGVAPYGDPAATQRAKRIIRILGDAGADSPISARGEARLSRPAMAPVGDAAANAPDTDTLSSRLQELPTASSWAETQRVERTRRRSWLLFTAAAGAILAALAIGAWLGSRDSSDDTAPTASSLPDLPAPQSATAPSSSPTAKPSQQPRVGAASASAKAPTAAPTTRSPRTPKILGPMEPTL